MTNIALSLGRVMMATFRTRSYTNKEIQLRTWANIEYGKDADWAYNRMLDNEPV